MNKKILELRSQKDNLIKEADEILKKAETEKRDLNDEEQKRWDEIMNKVDSLNENIKRYEKLSAEKKSLEGSANPVLKPEPGDPNIGMGKKDIKRYSLIRAIRAAASGSWAGAELEKEASEAVAKRFKKEPRGFFVPYDWLSAEHRDLTVGTGSEGGYLKATDLLSKSFIELLRNKMVVQSAGATVLSGLVGDIAIPKQSGGATMYWVSEGSAPTESQQTIAQVLLAPKSAAAYTDISRKLLLQSSIDVEAFVRNDLATAVALGIDLAALHGSGTGAEPTGVQNQTGVAVVALGTDGAAPTWASIVQLETEVAQDNADVGSLAYITNAKVRGKLKSTFKNATYGDVPIWENSNTPLNGYKAFVTNQVKSDLTKGTGTNLSAIFFGNWRDLIIGQWGTLDVLVDPYTGGTTGTVRVIVFQDVDIAVRHGESFSMIVDAVTT